ncbi:hypothetical protein GCM10017673_45000 [Streptosporangium violaceochromogenes]|nr:hypothetical protein GCM10017673_45000 [Streptosporangium violaceochromogenes]
MTYALKLPKRQCFPPTNAKGFAAKAYFSYANHAYLRGRRIKAVIPEKTDQARARRRRPGGQNGQKWSNPST